MSDQLFMVLEIESITEHVVSKFKDIPPEWLAHHLEQKRHGLKATDGLTFEGSQGKKAEAPLSINDTNKKDKSRIIV